MRATPGRSLVLPIILCSCSVTATAATGGPPPDGDYGDAPEGALAYPSAGTAGAFPTCFFGGPAGYIVHTVNARPMYFGPDVDFEMEGNAGTCPPPPYERDECLHPVDGDAGLIAPDPYTFDPGGLEISCSGQNATALGNACDIGQWGINIDILLTNFHPTIEAYVNVLFDWNQDGFWDGSASMCGPAPISEKVVTNLQVPIGFSGPLSTLLAGAQIEIGPNAGFVWVRFTITEQPVAADWFGAGVFDLGETEDYLLRIDDAAVFGEYGDAPEGVLAYPSNGVIGAFPTCVVAGPAGHVVHFGPNQSFFGPGMDFESDGNATQCAFPAYDEDECENNGVDAGLIAPGIYTVNAGLEVPCAGNPGISIGPACLPKTWGADLDIEITNNSADDRYVNVLFDWDQNGEWSGLVSCPAIDVPEHLVVNAIVPAGFAGLLSQLGLPAFVPPVGSHTWARFTISDSPVGQDWDGSGQFGDGETEDYLLLFDPAPVGVLADGKGVQGFELGVPRPNPFRERTSLTFSVPVEAIIELSIFDATGRRVDELAAGTLGVGTHTVHWWGRDASGNAVASGIYFAQLRRDGETVATRKIVLTR